ncbi:MAG: formate dehydrogenase subunit gamma [Hyphomonadaceae bacterium]|nr:formate dehydrogenase subunit gamma [Hyphomonadaceae bacterium]
MTKWDPEIAAEIARRHAGKEGALLPLLHDLMHEFGCVPDAAVPIAAEALNLSRAEVHGVVSFYHDFRREPAGKHLVQLCRAEACQARGGDAAAARCEAALGVAFGETRADGQVTLEPIYCLGLCASGPAALLDGAPVARLKGERLERLLAEAQR